MRNYGMGFVLSVLALLVSLFGLTRSDATAHSTTKQMLSRKALHTIAGAGMVCTKQVCNGPPKNCAPTLYNQVVTVIWHPHYQCEPGGVPNAYCANFGKNFLCEEQYFWPAPGPCVWPAVSENFTYVDICGL
jgi:hypothetical protein